ncbi:cell division/cell wall cluster transcriptional repressor MraZ [bacterium]|nr:cell division/cell wall cluster transcriptional repressor MraZ [bacterium]
MRNFLGDYECSIDSKSRLLIPSKFRCLIPVENDNKFVISLGKERCLNLYPQSEWKENVENRLHELPPGLEKRKIIRFYSKMSRHVESDKSGRIAIPRDFLEMIGNPTKIVAVGLLNYIELWSIDDYKEVSAKIEKDFQKMDWEY